MHLQSTDIQDVLETSFMDELAKIAESRRDNDQWITKSKLKTLLTTVAPATAIGTGLGYATSHAIRRAYEKNKQNIAGRIVRAVGPERVLKYGPTAGALTGAGIGTLAGIAASLHSRARKKAYEEKRHERP